MTLLPFKRASSAHCDAGRSVPGATAAHLDARAALPDSLSIQPVASLGRGGAPRQGRSDRTAGKGQSPRLCGDEARLAAKAPLEDSIRQLTSPGLHTIILCFFRLFSLHHPASED